MMWKAGRGLSSAATNSARLCSRTRRGTAGVVALATTFLAVAVAGCGSPAASVSPYVSPAPALTPGASASPTTVATSGASASPPQEGGTFRDGGSPAANLDFSLATLLLDGRVLFAGGLEGTSELYDPTTGTFHPSGSGLGRSNDTATLLRDGRVLIVGGVDAASPYGDYTASAELYDPTTGTFSPTGNMATARENQTATLLGDGRVLIVGGDQEAGADDNALASAELFDPATGKFSPTGSLRTAQTGQTATLLNDGRVLIAGGLDNSSNVAQSELYDPATGKFGLTGSMMTPRSGQTATLLSDGRVLMAGGSDNANQSLSSAEIYDPATGRFTRTGSMTETRDNFLATRLLDGRVLLAGCGNACTDDSAELYDPGTGTFTATGSLPPGLAAQTATLLPDGRVLLLLEDHSPETSGKPPVATAELYQP